MDELFTAIIAKFNADAVLTACNLYAYEAPQDATLPYFTYMLVINEPVEDFTDTSESSLIQFSIWDDSVSPLLVTQLANAFKAVFDWCSLTVAGRAHISMARQAERLIADPDGGWQYSIDYRTEIQ
jgi:hypothetical protein